VTARTHLTGTLKPDDPVGTGDDLTEFLTDPERIFMRPFTRLLIQAAAAAVAAPVELDRLYRAFPRQLITWQLYASLEDVPTASELAALVARIWPSDTGVPPRREVIMLARDWTHGRVST
jgi:hypothetical protein